MIEYKGWKVAHSQALGGRERWRAVRKGEGIAAGSEAELYRKIDQVCAPPPKYYECGACGHYHPAKWYGDCRSVASRFTAGELDELHGLDGWEDVPQGDGA